MQKKHVLLVIAILTSVLAAACGVKNEPGPADILARALEENKKPEAYYAESKSETMQNGKKVSTSVSKEWYSRDGLKNRIEMQVSGVDIGSMNVYIVNDGQKTINYQQGDKTAWYFDNSRMGEAKKQSPREELMQRLEGLQTYAELTLVGESEISGRKTYHLVAKPKEKKSVMGDQEIWIDQETWMIMKNIFNVEDIKIEHIYTKIEFAPQFKDDVFQIKLPKDVQLKDIGGMYANRTVTLSEARAVFGKPILHFRETSVVALAKAELTEIRIPDKSGIKSVTLTYFKNNAPYITISVTPMTDDKKINLSKNELLIRGQKGNYVDEFNVKLLGWRENGLEYMLDGTYSKLDITQLQKLTEEMVLYK